MEDNAHARDAWDNQRLTRRDLLRRAGLGGVVLAGGAPVWARPAASGATPAPAQPKKGGILRLRTTGNPAHFDMQVRMDLHGVMARQLACDKLVRYRHGPGVGVNELVIEPDLAERYEQSRDGKTYTFHLRKGVKFHNVAPVNGRELTSADVKWTFERQVRVVPAPNAVAFEEVDHYETPDKYTFRIVLKRPLVAMLDYLADPYVGTIIPREIEEKYGDFKNALVGTGPFYLENYTPGVSMKFRKNRDYWRPGLPHLDGVDIMIMPDDSSAVAALRSGQIDVMPIPARLAKAVQASNPELGFDKYMEFQHLYLSPNVKAAPYSDVRVRQALSLAIDRQDLLASVLGGEGAINGAIPAAFGDLMLPPSELPNWKHDPAKARKLLAEAGFPGGMKMKLTITVTYPEPYRSLAEAVTAQLKTVGINAELNVMQYADYAPYLQQFKHDVAYYSFYYRPNIDWVLGMAQRQSKSNTYGWSDPQFDDLFDRQRGAATPAERKKYLQEIQRRLGELCWLVSTVSQNTYAFRQPHVKNFRQSARGLWLGADVYDDVWLDRS